MSGPLKFCTVVRQPPIGSRDSLEAIRFSMGMTLLGNVAETYVVLEGDGVFHALDELPEKVLDRDTSRINVVDSIDFDGQIYAVQEDLAARGLSEKDLIPGVKVISAQQVAELVSQANTTHFM